MEDSFGGAGEWAGRYSDATVQRSPPDRFGTDAFPGPRSTSALPTLPPLLDAAFCTTPWRRTCNQPDQPITACRSCDRDLQAWPFARNSCPPKNFRLREARPERRIFRLPRIGLRDKASESTAPSRRRHCLPSRARTQGKKPRSRAGEVSPRLPSVPSACAGPAVARSRLRRWHVRRGGGSGPWPVKVRARSQRGPAPGGMSTGRVCWSLVERKVPRTKDSGRTRSPG
jgi:hypothetical protein